MTRLTVQEAQKRLPELLDEAANGEEIVVCGDGFDYKLVVTIEQPAEHARQVSEKPTPTFGSAKGRIKIADDFDEIPEGFESYVP